MKLNLEAAPEVTAREYLSRYEEWTREAEAQGEEGEHGAAYGILSSILTVALDYRDDEDAFMLARAILALLVV